KGAGRRRGGRGASRVVRPDGVHADRRAGEQQRVPLQDPARSGADLGDDERAPADRVPGCRLSADAAQGREPAPADLRAVDLSNSGIGRLTGTALAAGLTPAATLSSASVRRCVWKTSRSI